MFFYSIEFLIFLPLVVLVYFILPVRVKHLWLLAASYYFYMCWNAKYAVLILGSTLITYISGLLIERIKGLKLDAKNMKRAKNWVVAFSFVSNLAILFYFKYFNFALDLLSKVFTRININRNNYYGRIISR